MYLPNKYTSCYYNIISNAQARNVPDGYIEKHHIIPKCMGGSNHKSNIVKLTPREHFICHRLLTKMTVGELRGKMCYAAWAMATCKNGPLGERYKINSRTYDFIRSNVPHPPKTEEHKAKLRQKRTQETCDKISAARTGVSSGPRSDIQKAAAGAVWRGISRNEECSCIYCKKTTSLMNHKRWHGTNCKKNPDYIAPIKVTKTCEHCSKVVDLMNYTQWHGPKCKSLQFKEFTKLLWNTL